MVWITSHNTSNSLRKNFAVRPLINKIISLCVCHHDVSRSYLNFEVGKEQFLSTTPFVVHFEKICVHLREKANYCVKLHSSATKNDLERFLYFNQHSIAILDILRRQMSYKREKYIFISANLQKGKYTFIWGYLRVIDAKLNASGENTQTLQCRNHSLIFLPHCMQFNSIPGRH